MKTALIGAVSFNAQHFATQHFDMVVAVDRGWRTCCDCGIAADVAIGDFDSLGYAPKGVPVVQFPSVKDESDMELALDHVLRLGATEAYVYGALSDRLDHTLANIQVFAAFAARGMRVVGVGDAFALVALAAGEGVAPGAPYALAFSDICPEHLSGPYAPYASNFAIGGPVHGLTITGMKYATDQATLLPDCSLGLSNQFVESGVRIEIAHGYLVSMFPLGALSHATFIF